MLARVDAARAQRRAAAGRPSWPTQLGCSRRHLVNRFADDIGAPPKLAARMLRFEHARRRLGSAPLARLAAECGYADQAHLSREFSELAGAPPTAFPFVQDARRGHGVASAGMPQTVFPCITFRDANASIDWLERALGAERVEVHEDDEGLVAHAEIRIGESVVMCRRRARRLAGHAARRQRRLRRRARRRRRLRAGRAAGAEVTEPVDQDYGSRDLTVTDPDGNRWSLGTYAGAG